MLGELTFSWLLKLKKTQLTNITFTFLQKIQFATSSCGE